MKVVFAFPVLLRLPFLGVIFLVTLNSCIKVDVPIVNQEAFSTLNAYIQSKSPTAEYFSVLTDVESTLITKNGSIITIPKDAFITASGLPISGMVNIKFKEVFSKAEMMFSGVFPISNGIALNSGGQFFIQASQNGNSLRVANSAFIEVDIPAIALDDAMELFLAGPDEFSDTTTNWAVIDTSRRQSFSDFNYNSNSNRYNIRLDSMGWINIDAFRHIPTKFNCIFNISGLGGLNYSNTTAYAIFKDMNCVMPIGTYQGGISDKIIQSILPGVQMNLVVISIVDSKLYYGLLDFIPVEGIPYNILMIETTSTELDEIIADL